MPSHISRRTGVCPDSVCGEACSLRQGFLQIVTTDIRNYGVGEGDHLVDGGPLSSERPYRLAGTHLERLTHRYHGATLLRIAFDDYGVLASSVEFKSNVVVVIV